VAGEFEAGGGAGGAANLAAVGFEAGKGLFGALADEIALDFGGKAESEGQDLALDVVAQAVAVLDGPNSGPKGHDAG